MSSKINTYIDKNTTVSKANYNLVTVGFWRIGQKLNWIELNYGWMWIKCTAYVWQNVERLDAARLRKLLRLNIVH